MDQPAATTWYHPHLHGTTAEHVYRGLAGMFILDDAQSRELDLPSEYGVDDIPVIVQDKKFDGGGQLDRGGTMFSPVGLLGDTILTKILLHRGVGSSCCCGSPTTPTRTGRTCTTATCSATRTRG